MAKHSSTRVAIVGGGPAGLTAAYYLKQAGFRNVTVLERDTVIGGKCLTRDVNGNSYDMGAIELSPDYTHILEIAKSLGLGMSLVPEPRGIDPETGKESSFENIVFEDANVFSLALAGMKYFLELEKHSGSLGDPGFRQLDPELCKPFATWLSDNGMSALANGFIMPITCYGYGYLREIPAAYVLKYINRRNFGLVVYNAGKELLIPEPLQYPDEWPKRLTKGFGNFAEQLSGLLDDVRLGANIVKITRGADVTITYQDGPGGTLKNLVVDELIVTIPQVLSNLSFLSLTQDEQDLFKQVEINQYYTTLCEIDGLDNELLLEVLSGTNVVEPISGYPAQILKSWPNSNLCVAYTYSDAIIDKATVEANLKTNVAKMNKTLGKIHETLSWQYFPHVKTTGLQAGFYDKLDLIQGANRTYWGGGLLNFELVENVAAWSKQLVDRFFA